MMDLHLNRDAWASGQIGSKLWLCRELERVPFAKPPTIWILGGWYGTLAHLLLARERLAVEKIRSFDIDPACAPNADAINDFHHWQNWKFKAFTQNCDELKYERTESYQSEAPDLVINTAAEHFPSTRWWDRIPSGTMVALQSTDMDHADHVFRTRSEEELARIFKLSKTHFAGSLAFDYGNASSFRRFMLIGIK